MEYLFVALLAVWVPTAIACNWLAGEKGHSVTSWTIAGLFLGPLALLTLGFAPRGYSDPFRPCVECLEPVFQDATKCPYCQTDLIPEAEDEDAVE